MIPRTPAAPEEVTGDGAADTLEVIAIVEASPPEHAGKTPNIGSLHAAAPQHRLEGPGPGAVPVVMGTVTLPVPGAGASELVAALACPGIGITSSCVELLSTGNGKVIDVIPELRGVIAPPARFVTVEAMAELPDDVVGRLKSVGRGGVSLESVLVYTDNCAAAVVGVVVGGIELVALA